MHQKLETFEEVMFGEWSADFDVSLQFDVDKGEKRTRDYPGSAPYAALTDWHIVEMVRVFNKDGDHVMNAPSSNVILKGVIDTYIMENISKIEERALESWIEDESAAEEYTAECEGDRKREERHCGYWDSI